METERVCRCLAETGPRKSTFDVTKVLLNNYRIRPILYSDYFISFTSIFFGALFYTAFWHYFGTNFVEEFYAIAGV